MWQTGVLCILIAISLRCAHARNLQQVAQGKDTVVFCTADPTVSLPDCGAALSRNSTFRFTCVRGKNAEECMTLIKAGDAQLMRVGGDDLFTSGSMYDLVPLVSEYYGDSLGTAYFSVAVVDKAFCKPDTTLASLKGTRSCHTGYRRGAGWTLPLGQMFGARIIPVVDTSSNIQNDAESVAAFFAKSCAPKATVAGPVVGGKLWKEGLCTACKGDCTEKDPYFDYEGAVRCLMEGAGDVAFTKHSTLLNLTKDGLAPQPWSTKSAEDLRLLCLNGGCKPITEYATCNVAMVPAHAVMTSPQFAQSQLGAAVATYLVAASEIPSVMSGLRAQKVVQSTARELKRVDRAFEQYVGQSFLSAYRGLGALNALDVSFCNVGQKEQEFCQQVVTLMNQKKLGATFKCIMKDTNSACLKAIENGEATMRTFDSGDIYEGHMKHGLKVIVAEDYGEEMGTEYYSVAIVNKQFCDANPSATYAALKGKGSCHTGYGRTAGWRMPVGMLLGNGSMPLVSKDAGVANDAESIAAFFSKVCAPDPRANGPKNTADKMGEKWDKTCSACKGDCLAKDEYAGYDGALRCFMEGSGDVAWVKHTTAMEFASDGKTPKPWSSKKMEDMRLLCPRGGCVPVTQYVRCNVARVPAHAVMVKSTNPQAAAITEALVRASKDPDFRTLVFSAQTNANDDLFKSSTKALEAVNEDTLAFLGDAAVAFRALANLQESGSVSAASASTSSKKGLSTGAVIGIAVGCAVGGILLAAAVGVIILKRRTSQHPFVAQKDSGMHFPSTDGKATPL